MEPLLFILTLDRLYNIFCARDDLHGIILRQDDRSETITVSGYVDDTAVYLRVTGDISKVLELLNIFAHVSGLTINQSKSVV